MTRVRTFVLPGVLFALCITRAVADGPDTTCDPSNVNWGPSLKAYCQNNARQVELWRQHELQHLLNEKNQKLQLYYYASDPSGPKISWTFSMDEFLALDQATQKRWIDGFIRAVGQIYDIRHDLGVTEALSNGSGTLYDWIEFLDYRKGAIGNADTASMVSADQLGQDIARQWQTKLAMDGEKAELESLRNELVAKYAYTTLHILRLRVICQINASALPHR